MSHLVKSTLIVTVFNAFGLILGFLSGLVLAWYFGAGSYMDIYLAAIALPTFLGSIIGSLLNIAFIPVFVEHKNCKDIWSIVSSILNISVIATIILACLIIVFARPIMSVLTPGFHDENLKLVTTIVQYQIPIIIIIAINELMAGIYYSNQKFITPFLNKLISPLITILFVVFFSRSLSVISLVYATITAMVIQTLILSFGFYKNEQFHYKFSFDYKNPIVVKTFKLMLPLAFGMLFSRILPVFDRFIASSLAVGSISYLGYSFRIFSQIPPLISTGISITLFPVLSAMATNKDWNGLKHTMSKSIKIILFLSLPIVFVFVLNSQPVIQLLFQRGKFTATDSQMTSIALSIYILALPMATMGDIISKGFYALQDTLTPALISILEISIYIFSVCIFLPKFEYLAIPMAYAIYFNFSVVNCFFVRKKLGGKGGRSIVIFFLKNIFYSILVFGVFFFIIRSSNNLILKNCLIILSLITYFSLNIFVLKTEEGIFIWNNIVKGLFYKIKNNTFSA